MTGFFRKGLGWKLHKQYIRYFNRWSNDRAYKRVLSERAKPQISSTTDLDQLFPDNREAFEDPVEKVRYISIRILQILDKVAKENGFDYMLAYGTLLGAIRHGGFIPWDDDIDTMMTKSDFNKLVACSNQLPDSLILFRMSKNFWKLMDRYSTMSKDGKRGVAVDIFLLDDAVGPKAEDHFSFINVHRVRYEDLPKAAIFPLKNIPFTKDHEFPAPADPDAILTHIYRDYMQLPPEDQRVNPHLGANMEFRSLDNPPIHHH